MTTSVNISCNGPDNVKVETVSVSQGIEPPIVSLHTILRPGDETRLHVHQYQQILITEVK